MKSLLQLHWANSSAVLLLLLLLQQSCVLDPGNDLDIYSEAHWQK